MTLTLEALRELKKSSNKMLENISNELKSDETNKSNTEDDGRFWKAGIDKAGNGYAVIRFLPAINPNEKPWVKIYDKGFQGPTGKWYIENCLTTIGQPDPVVDYCNKLWEGSESDKEQARKMKRRLSYYANVLIVKDPANPDNEGKVFIFKFGKKIFEKIKAALAPEFEDEERINVFDPWNGANFRLKIARVDGWSRVDSSYFDKPSPIGDDETILNVLNQRHDLSFLVAPERFKTYDELKRKFESVMGISESSVRTVRRSNDDDEDVVEMSAPAKAAPAKKTKEATPPWEDDAVKVAVEDDDDLSYFKDIMS